MQPNPALHNPEPVAVRRLVDAVMERHGWSQNEVARRIGVGERALRYWTTGHRTMPYSAQYTLEGYL